MSASQADWKESVLREGLSMDVSEWDDPTFLAYLESGARVWLLNHARESGLFRKAFDELLLLEPVVDRFERLLDGDPDEAYNDALLTARLAGALLDIDLGRLESASQRISAARTSGLEGNLLARYTASANQLFLLTDQLKRVSSLPDRDVHPLLRRHLDRHGILRDLLLGQRDPAGSAETLNQAKQWLLSEGRPLPDRVRVGCEACVLAVAADDEGSAREVLGLVEAAASQLESPELALRVLPRIARAEVLQAFGAEEGGEDESRLAVQAAWKELKELSGAIPSLPGGIGIFVDRSRRDLLCRTVMAVRGVEGDEAALRVLLEGRELGRADADRTIDVNFEEFGQWLAHSNAGALCWISGRGQTLVAALDGQGVAWFVLDPLSLHRDSIDGLARALGGGGGEAAEPASELARALLPKALCERMSSWSQVFVSGHDWIEEIELEALPLGKEGPFGLCRSVSYIPSLNFLEVQRLGSSELSDALSAAALVGTGLGFDSASIGHVEALPVVKGIEKVFELPFARDSRVFVGSQARLSEFASEPSDLLTVFAHGVFDTSRLSPAGLLLAGPDGARVEGWEDLRSLPAPQLCVLLACGGARGSLRQGEGGYSRLPGALLAAGSSAVLASRRDLDAEQALRLYAEWVQQVDSGLSVGEALRVAKQTLAQQPEANPPKQASPESWATLLSVHGLGTLLLLQGE